MSNNDIGIDLGTSNIVITMGNKGVVLSEPSVIAYNTRTERVLAVGKEAYEMIGRNPDYICVSRPVTDGVISDDDLAKSMIREFIIKISGHQLLKPRIIICVPAFVTDIESRAVVDAVRSAGARQVYLIQEPVAGIIGAEVDIAKAKGHMIVDIGGGTTEIAVISLGGIVSNKSIQIAGDDLTDDIQNHMRRAHNVKVGERTAELIKMNVGSALTELENPPEDYIVHGPNMMTALPMEVPVSYQEISHCIEKSISKIEAAVLGALEQTPPELYADIVRNGIYLAGGGALLRGLDKRLTDKIGIQFHIAEDPLLAVAKGTGVALKNIDKFSFLIR